MFDPFKRHSNVSTEKISDLQNEEQGGAGSEVWNRVYMIAPVKKFGRVRLYHFPSKQIWRRTWRDDEFLLGFEFSRVQTSRKGFQEHF